MHHAVDAAIKPDEEAELGDVADRPLDVGARRMIGGEGDPGILLGLLQAQRNAALLGIDLEHLHFDLLARRDDLARVDVLLGPAHLRHMDQSLHAGLELDEGAIVGDVGDGALEPRANQIFGGNALPRIGFELLDAEADALGLGIDADDLHLDAVANVHDLARMSDAPPCHLGDVQQAVDAAEVDEGAIVGDVLDHALNDLTLFQPRHDLAALLGARLFEHRAARHDDVAAAAVHFQDLEGLRHVHQRRHVADRPDVDLATRQESDGAVEIDGEAAFDAVEDHAFDALAGLVFFLEPRPALLAARFFARQHGLAHGVLDALEIDVDLVAHGKVGGTAGDAKFFQGNAALGLEADIDHRNVLLDPDDGALDDVTFLQRRGGQRLFKQGRELVVARMADASLRFVHKNSLVPSNRIPRPLPAMAIAKARGQTCSRLPSPHEVYRQNFAENFRICVRKGYRLNRRTLHAQAQHRSGRWQP